jgi:hypothetical protein
MDEGCRERQEDPERLRDHYIGVGQGAKPTAPDRSLEAEISRLEDQVESLQGGLGRCEETVRELSEYVREAGGTGSVLLPVSTLGMLISKEQHMQAVVNVMELDQLRRCHEDRFELKQKLRELEAEVGRLRGIAPG